MIRKLMIMGSLVGLMFSNSSTRAASEEGRKTAGPSEWIGDLSPISAEDWSYDRAAHLLERAGFGGTPEEIERLAAMTPDEAVDHLVNYESIDNSDLKPFMHSRDEEGRSLFEILEAPIHLEIRNAINYATEHGEALGVKVDYSNPATRFQEVGAAGYFHVAATRYEMDRVVQWWGNRMLNTNRPLEEKLVLFWHGHFATGHKKVHDYSKMLGQIEMLRENATANFRDLLLGIARDPPCCATSTTPTTSRATPTRTSPARSWNCSPWEWATTPKWTSAKRRGRSPAGRIIRGKNRSL